MLTFILAALDFPQALFLQMLGWGGSGVITGNAEIRGTQKFIG